MNEKTAPSLTPPTKGKVSDIKDAKPKATKEPKVPKEPKAPKVAKPRGNYGYHVDAKIEINKEKEITYKGQRKEWFDLLAGFDGKTVKEFNEATKGRKNNKGTPHSPSGWLRFFALDSAVKLQAPPPVATPTPTPAA